MFYLLTRRFYRSAGKIGDWVEFIGRESFFFFIAHWLFIDTLTLFFKTARWYLPMIAMVFGFTSLVIRPLARVRDRGAGGRAYARRWFIVMAVSAAASPRGVSASRGERV
ncbi:MAG: hypothetical protein M5R36_13590 [Deltaproteobacteria bacterium]|nr:hypothetical protein [Deltaproteobacteria bacterium]